MELHEKHHNCLTFGNFCYWIFFTTLYVSFPNHNLFSLRKLRNPWYGPCSAAVVWLQALWAGTIASKFPRGRDTAPLAVRV